MGEYHCWLGLCSVEGPLGPGPSWDSCVAGSSSLHAVFQPRLLHGMAGSRAQPQEGKDGGSKASRDAGSETHLTALLLDSVGRSKSQGQLRCRWMEKLSLSPAGRQRGRGEGWAHWHGRNLQPLKNAHVCLLVTDCSRSSGPDVDGALLHSRQLI